MNKGEVYVGIFLGANTIAKGLQLENDIEVFIKTFRAEEDGNLTDHIIKNVGQTNKETRTVPSQHSSDSSEDASDSSGVERSGRVGSEKQEQLKLKIARKYADHEKAMQEIAREQARMNEDPSTHSPSTSISSTLSRRPRDTSSHSILDRLGELLVRNALLL